MNWKIMNWKMLTLAGALSLAPLTIVVAQPPAKAEVEPQPLEKIKKPRVPKANKENKANKAKEPQPDDLLKNFEALFGRKLTDDETAQLKKATAARQAAIRAAQDDWRKQFLQITGVTEAELKQKQREARLKNKDNKDARKPMPKQPDQQPAEKPDAEPANAEMPAPAAQDEAR